jgi:hypothetical protein
MMKRFILVLFALAFAPLAHGTSCSSTTIGSYVCTFSTTVGGGTTSESYTFSSGHTAGHTVLACASGNSSGVAFVAGNLTNTLGWSWSTAQAGGGGAAQAVRCWIYYVLTTTSSSDTVQINNSSFTYMILAVADFTGSSGLVDGAGAYSGTGSGSGSYSFSSTSLPIGFGIGSATLGAGTGWTVLDNTSPYSILEYKAAGGTSANATFVTTYTGAIGIALQVASSAPVCRASVSSTGAGSC